MPTKIGLAKSQKAKSSNLAAEYYVASLLFRLGYVVTVTFGNTKEIDLIVYDPETQKTVTIDVKGLKNTTNWIMPKNLCQKPDHYYILVTFKNKLDDLDTIPEVYTLPCEKVPKLLRNWVGREDVKAIPYYELREYSEFKGIEGIRQLFQK